MLPLVALIAPAGGAEAVVALAALRAALAGFVRTRQRSEHDPQETARWEGEGGPPGALSACLLGALAVAGPERDAGAGWPEAALGLAMAAGLFTGHDRAGDQRRI